MYMKRENCKRYIAYVGVSQYKHTLFCTYVFLDEYRSSLIPTLQRIHCHWSHEVKARYPVILPPPEPWLGRMLPASWKMKVKHGKLGLPYCPVLPKKYKTLRSFLFEDVLSTIKMMKFVNSIFPKQNANKTWNHTNDLCFGLLGPACNTFSALSEPSKITEDAQEPGAPLRTGLFWTSFGAMLGVPWKSSRSPCFSFGSSPFVSQVRYVSFKIHWVLWKIECVWGYFRGSLKHGVTLWKSVAKAQKH